jgi:DNA-binding response OmpR family regulator
MEKIIFYQIYEPTNESKSVTDKASVLIVDDSDDVRKYLSNLLENYYTISSASNGEEGIKTATENMPDLIISDIMMPSMDGIEFCRRIKSEWQTSDIPVILLTAKASFDSKLEGLGIGADDYLTKPFQSKELFIRIKNLLEQRKRLREKYSADLNQIPQISEMNDADQEFIHKAHDVIQMNIDKTSFNTENLAKELFLSRSQLHRKMIAITGQAPGEFIRTIKLNEAAKMLLGKKLTVTQVAYEIGFSSPAQFSRAFSKQFNCLPSEYSARNKN